MATPVSAAPAPAMLNKTLQGGVVRSCPSGDTLVVRPRGVVTPGAERTIHIAGIAAPRLGSRERDDDVSSVLVGVNSRVLMLVFLFRSSLAVALCFSIQRVSSETVGRERSAIPGRIQRSCRWRRSSARVCTCLSSPGKSRVSLVLSLPPSAADQRCGLDQYFRHERLAQDLGSRLGKGS